MSVIILNFSHQFYTKASKVQNKTPSYTPIFERVSYLKYDKTSGEYFLSNDFKGFIGYLIERGIIEIIDYNQALCILKKADAINVMSSNISEFIENSSKNHITVNNKENFRRVILVFDPHLKELQDPILISTNDEYCRYSVKNLFIKYHWGKSRGKRSILFAKNEDILESMISDMFSYMAPEEQSDFNYSLETNFKYFENKIFLVISNVSMSSIDILKQLYDFPIPDKSKKINDPVLSSLNFVREYFEKIIVMFKYKDFIIDEIRKEIAFDILRKKIYELVQGNHYYFYTPCYKYTQCCYKKILFIGNVEDIVICSNDTYYHPKTVEFVISNVKNKEIFIFVKNNYEIHEIISYFMPKSSLNFTEFETYFNNFFEYNKNKIHFIIENNLKGGSKEILDQLFMSRSIPYMHTNLS